MAKKTVEQLVKEMQSNIDTLSEKYMNLLLEPEDGEGAEQKKEEKKRLKELLSKLKTELKFIKSMEGPKADKKKEKELKKQQDDIINWVKKMPSSIGDIVKTIPKH